MHDLGGDRKAKIAGMVFKASNLDFSITFLHAMPVLKSDTPAEARSSLRDATRTLPLR